MPCTVYFVLILINIFLTPSLADDCVVTAPDGSVYNLNPLKELGVISQVDSMPYWNYSVSICSNIIPCANCPVAGYCQNAVDRDDFTYCIGLFETPIIPKAGGAGVDLVYREPAPGGGSVGRITINCKHGGELVSNKIAITPDKVTDFHFMFDSSAACGQNCLAGTSCTTCANLQSSCAWCLDTSSCVSLNATCLNWIRNPEFCPGSRCRAFSTCDTCTFNRCSWCLGSNCVSYGEEHSCKNGSVRDPEYCNLE